MNISMHSELCLYSMAELEQLISEKLDLFKDKVITIEELDELSITISQNTREIQRLLQNYYPDNSRLAAYILSRATLDLVSCVNNILQDAL